MKSVDCNIIKDLLPSYLDKVSSKETNRLIEMHLQTCKDCSKTLKEMNEEEGFKTIDNQNEQIDYLKGYRKKKIFSIASAVIITIFIISDIFLIGATILHKKKFDINVTDVEICYTGIVERDGNKTLCYEMTSDTTWLDPFCWDYDIIKDIENKTVYLKVVGRFTFGHKARSFCIAEIDDETEYVYLIDAKGNKRIIWDKEQGVLTKKHL